MIIVPLKKGLFVIVVVFVEMLHRKFVPIKLKYDMYMNHCRDASLAVFAS